ncbi:uncharacterized protein LOC105428866 [Pogonomyrmex barbatus]|uniref:Uncharacterized protein LOC105428866 n=1 Tax=Pogonomyrmex barbatus TaxID=144034 RepID=A0A6I9WBK1_9HYME|nr:uncharacterized protein LOC105428866 [Pogonomyrmex barbatus]XP_011639735.1 uncharacterized protein LOC105428866 [Pogonomyrmex barbatus]XP_011639736.1 uncharacterized protein LOC105428866 [Pogonomyrmex barbatus]
MPSLDSNIEERSNLNESINNTPASEKDIAHVTDHTEYKSYLHENTDGNFCETLPTASVCNYEKSLDNADDNIMKFTNFVTMKRGHSKALEEIENFTLLLHQSAKNREFDIDELRLPVLGDSAINESSTNNKIDSEVTVTISRITNISIASVLNRNLNESEYDRIMKLPLFINDHKRISEANQIKKSENSLDPSSAKVVFMNESSKFMNESHLKTRVLPANGTQSANSLRKESTSEEKSLRDSENDIYTSGRPRRRKAPVNLKEPSLNTKLRRNE